MNSFTPIDEALDPNVIFERGFVTKEEMNATDLSKLASKVRIEAADGDGRLPEGEGIWAALISQEDRDLYDGTTVGQTIRAVLLNPSFMFAEPTWGRVIVGKTNGGSRPIFKREEQVPRFIETHEAYMTEFPRKEKSDGTAAK